MKSIFDQATRDELIKRISLLDANSTAQWGKMDVSQMMKHCSQWDEMALGRKSYKQSLIGKLFGRIALKDMMKDVPMKKNMPTVPSFKITQALDLKEEKTKWLQLLQEYDRYASDGFIHPFFGPLSKEQTGYLVYKHIDHHLRQFNS